MPTFFTDFSEYADGTDLKNVNGWSLYKNTAPYSMVAHDTGGADGTVMRWTRAEGSANWNVLAWDTTKGRAATVEILTAIRYNAPVGSGTYPAVMLGPHFNVSNDVTNAYRASFNSNAAYWHNAYWRDNNLGGYASRENVTPRPTENEKWWYRYRCERNTPQIGTDRLSVRYWKDGDAEPATWSLQDDIVSVGEGIALDPGVGASAIAIGSTYDVIQFGVGTNGDDAPSGELPGNPAVSFSAITDIAATSAATEMSYTDNESPTSAKQMWATVQNDALPDPTATQVKTGLAGDGSVANSYTFFDVGNVANPTVPVPAEGLPQVTTQRFWGVCRENGVDVLGSSDAFDTLASQAGISVVMVDGTGTPLAAGRAINYRVYSEAAWNASAAPQLSGVAVTGSDGSIQIDTAGVFITDDIVRLVTDEAGGDVGVLDDYLGASWQTVI